VVRKLILLPAYATLKSKDSKLEWVLTRVPGLSQITWKIVLTKKIMSHEGENFGQKGRKIEI